MKTNYKTLGVLLNRNETLEIKGGFIPDYAFVACANQYDPNHDLKIVQCVNFNKAVGCFGYVICSPGYRPVIAGYYGHCGVQNPWYSFC